MAVAPPKLSLTAVDYWYGRADLSCVMWVARRSADFTHYLWLFNLDEEIISIAAMDQCKLRPVTF